VAKGAERTVFPPKPTALHQVYPPIAVSHFSSIKGAVHVWNFRTPNGGVLFYRYLAQYGRDITLKATRIKERECAASVNAPTQVAQPALVRLPVVAGQQAGALFPFGRSGQSDISPRGRTAAVIECLAPDRRVTIDVNGQLNP
jgi:hypothetical protein